MTRLENGWSRKDYTPLVEGPIVEYTRGALVITATPHGVVVSGHTASMNRDAIHDLSTMLFRARSIYEYLRDTGEVLTEELILPRQFSAASA